MRVQAVLVILAILTTHVQAQTMTGKAELLKVDREFAAMARSQGVNAAFDHFAAEDMIRLVSDKMPVLGKAAQAEYIKAHPDTSYTLIWEPLRAELAASGELGYTIGNWRYFRNSNESGEPDAVGVYITIWKKQPDGLWKFVVDGGSSTPELWKGND